MGVGFRVRSTAEKLIKGMPVAHEIDDRAQVITMTVTAPITLKDLLEDYQKIFQDQRFVHNMNAVWDISHLNLMDIPTDKIRQLPRQMKQFMERRGSGYKAALVTNRALDFQLLRLYVTILRLIGNIRFNVFRSLDDAYAWASTAESEE